MKAKKGITIKGRYFSPEQVEILEETVAAHYREWLDWMLPYYQPFITKAKGKWQVIQYEGEGNVWCLGMAGLRVCLGGDIYDGQRWLHVSMSREGGRYPTWQDMVRVKETFLGAESKAIQVFAPRSEWVNLEQNVLHLYLPLDKPDLLPDFRIEVPNFGKTI